MNALSQSPVDRVCVCAASKVFSPAPHPPVAVLVSLPHALLLSSSLSNPPFLQMDSDLTLVNAAPPTSYFLSSADLEDAVIYAHPGVPLYRVTSDARHVTIYDSTDRVIAVLHRRDLFSDTISFPQRHSDNGTGVGTHVSIQRWLRRSRLPDGT